MQTKFLGSCLCEQVKFEIDGNFDKFFLCHCKYCQKDTGSAFAANLFSNNAILNWKSGSDKVKTFNLAPTRHTKSFCSDCGSALPTEHGKGKLLVVPAGCIDTGNLPPPSAHIFCSSKASWEDYPEDIKKFEKFPS